MPPAGYAGAAGSVPAAAPLHSALCPAFHAAAWQAVLQ